MSPHRSAPVGGEVNEAAKLGPRLPSDLRRNIKDCRLHWLRLDGLLHVNIVTAGTLAVLFLSVLIAAACTKCLQPNISQRLFTSAAFHIWFFLLHFLNLR